MGQELLISAVALRLNLAKSTLEGWGRRAKHSHGKTVPGAGSVFELEAEISKLRKGLI